MTTNRSMTFIEIFDNIANKKSKINIENNKRPDFDNMMNDIENEVEEQQTRNGH